MDGRLNETDQHWKTDSVKSKQTEAVDSDRALRHNSEIENYLEHYDAENFKITLSVLFGIQGIIFYHF